MVLCLVIYINRVYLTKGFKTPRVTWFTGTLLFVVTVSFGISGYSLLCALVSNSFLGLLITGVLDILPLLGKYIIHLLRGRTSVGQETLTRFFSGHTFVLLISALTILLTHSF